jgi:hypothetical protein
MYIYWGINEKLPNGHTRVNTNFSLLSLYVFLRQTLVVCVPGGYMDIYSTILTFVISSSYMSHVQVVDLQSNERGLDRKQDYLFEA